MKATKQQLDKIRSGRYDKARISIIDTIGSIESKIANEFRRLNMVEMFYPKQCDEFHRALEEGDAIKAHYLFIPPSVKPLYLIEHERRMAELKERHDAEVDRIEKLSPKMLEMEIKYRHK